MEITAPEEEKKYSTIFYRFRDQGFKAKKGIHEDLTHYMFAELRRDVAVNRHFDKLTIKAIWLAR